MDGVTGLADVLATALRFGEPLDMTAGGALNPATAEDWAPERIIPADQLRRVLLDTREADPRGLTIIGAVVTGRLDLSYANLRYPLRFQACRMTAQLDLSHASIRDLEISASSVADIWASHLTTDSLLLRDVKFGNNLKLMGSRVGHLGLIQLSLPNNSSLDLSHASVAGGVRIDGLYCSRLLASEIRVGGDLVLVDSFLSPQDDTILDLAHSRITGNLLIDRLFTEGEVRLESASLGGSLVIRDSRFDGDNGGLNLNSATIPDGLFLGPGSVFESTIFAPHVHIGNLLDLRGSFLQTLILREAVIDGDIHLDVRFSRVGRTKESWIRRSKDPWLNQYMGRKDEMIDLVDAVITGRVMSRGQASRPSRQRGATPDGEWKGSTYWLIGAVLGSAITIPLIAIASLLDSNFAAELRAGWSGAATPGIAVLLIALTVTTSLTLSAISPRVRHGRR